MIEVLFLLLMMSLTGDVKDLPTFLRVPLVFLMLPAGIILHTGLFLAEVFFQLLDGDLKQAKVVFFEYLQDWKDLPSEIVKAVKAGDTWYGE
jgi:hypothetical protein